jgi:hypothetical protein
VINISNCVVEDNPCWGPALAGGPAGYAERPGLRDRRDLGRTPPPGNRGWAAFGLVVGWLAYFLRRLGDRQFAVTDTEAFWWGWQITKTAGGLGRRYRDTRFDALGEAS